MSVEADPDLRHDGDLADRRFLLLALTDKKNGACSPD
jgi:hypothetical protein